MTEAEKIWQDRLTAAAARLDQNRPAYPGTNLMRSYEREAACRLIEEFEAFKREVSDAVEYFSSIWTGDSAIRKIFMCHFRDFIIAKPEPDPLIEVVKAMVLGASKTAVNELCETLAKRGLKIVEVDDD